MGTIKRIINELTKPKSFKLGESFEEFTRENLFTKEHYKLLERTHNYSDNKEDYVHSSLNPDFKFLDLKTKKEFWVECKFRSDYNDKIFWAKQSQIKRYNEIDSKIPVFILLGIMGKPNNPELVSLIPLKDCQYEGLFFSYIEKYSIEEEPIYSQRLWQNISH